MACNVMSKTGVRNVRSGQGGSPPRLQLEHHLLAVALVIHSKELHSTSWGRCQRLNPVTSTSWLSEIISRRLFHEVFAIQKPGSKDRSREAGEGSHFQVWSARKDPFRSGTKLRISAVSGNVFVVQNGQDQNLSVPPRK